MLIELKGHVNEQGIVEIVWPNDLPTGDVRVLLEFIDPAVEAADEALWQAQFARSPKVIDFLIQEALDEEAAGLTDDWDPETEPDKPSSRNVLNVFESCFENCPQMSKDKPC